MRIIRNRCPVIPLEVRKGGSAGRESDNREVTEWAEE